MVVYISNLAYLASAGAKDKCQLYAFYFPEKDHPSRVAQIPGLKVRSGRVVVAAAGAPCSGYRAALHLLPHDQLPLAARLDAARLLVIPALHALRCSLPHPALPHPAAGSNAVDGRQGGVQPLWR